MPGRFVICLLGCVSAAFVLTAASGAHASQTLVEVRGAEGLWTSDFDGQPNPPGFPNQFADTFTLDEAAFITDLDFAGGYFNLDAREPADDFTVRFFPVTGGRPAAEPLLDVKPVALAVEIVQPETPNAIGIFGYSAQLAAQGSGLFLPAGDYGLSILNNTADDPSWWSIRLAVDLGGQAFARRNDGDAWSTVLGELAFRLRGHPIPEPAALATLATLLLLPLAARPRPRK